MCPLHPWDAAVGNIQHPWDDARGEDISPPHPWDASADTDDEPPDPDNNPDAAADVFIEMLLELYLYSSIGAEAFCTPCWWASKANMVGRVNGAQSSKYKPWLDLKLGLRNKMSEFYRLDIIGQDRNTPGKRVPCSLPVRFAHECMEADMDTEEAGDMMSFRLQEAKNANRLPLSYHDHPIVQSYPDEDVIPYGIYMDALPYSNNDGVLAIWLVNLLTNSRDIMGIIRKRVICACGCRGWCTFFCILVWLHDAIEAMCNRRHIGQRHDGKPWHIPTDATRAKNAGQLLRKRGCVLQFRADWPELCNPIRSAKPQFCNTAMLLLQRTRGRSIRD